MNKLKAILVDDESGSRSVIRDLLDSFCPDILIAGEAADVESACKLIEQCDPDLVFLDVQMPRGNGFSLLTRFEVLPFDVIFVTGYDQYAINAIRFSALDYLLKPIDISLLKTAVEKAIRKQRFQPIQKEQVVNLIYNAEAGQDEQRIALHHNDAVRIVAVRDIMYIEGLINYTNVFTINGEKFISSRTLKEFEDFLALSGLFIRIHRGAMINMNFIFEYSKGDPFIITMKDGRSFEASRRKKTEVLTQLRKS